MNNPHKLSIRILAVLVACFGFYLYLLSASGSSFETFLLFEFAAAYLYFYASKRRSASAMRSRTTTRRRSRSTSRPNRIPKTSHRPNKNAKQEIAKHTLAAVRNAGRDPDESPVRLLDIGLLVYFEESDEPKVYRIRSIPDEAQAIRPYAILHLSERAYGPIRFEICDNSMQMLFRDEEEYQFEIGKNYRTTKYYLRLRDEIEVRDRWCLRMFSGEHAIAFHYFDWHSRIDFNIAADGEVSAEDRESFMEEVPEGISLDQLISTIG